MLRFHRQGSTICSPVDGAGQRERELDRPIAQSFCIEEPIYFVCVQYALDKYRVDRNECGTKTSCSTPLEQESRMARLRMKTITMQKRTSGMARFFSKSNRDRYRKLASGTISRVEQHQLLDDLAQEVDAFKREARCCLSPADENNIGSDSRDQYDRSICSDV
jgi:hypothetical protein